MFIFVAFNRIVVEHQIFLLKLHPFSQYFILNFLTQYTLHHLSALDMKYKMFTPAYTGINQV